jgi:hypothetical protein
MYARASESVRSGFPPGNRHRLGEAGAPGHSSRLWPGRGNPVVKPGSSDCRYGLNRAGGAPQRLQRILAPSLSKSIAESIGRLLRIIVNGTCTVVRQDSHQHSM